MRALDDQAGFTLIEVMVASLIMLIGVFGIIAAFPKAFSTTVDAGKTMVLNHLAAAKMDELRALGFSHSDLNIGTHGTLVAHSGGDYLQSFPNLRTGIPFGMPHPNLGEVIVLCAVAMKGCELEEEQIQAFLKERLAAYKLPRKILVFSESALIANRARGRRG